jgi:hypothetical protein
MTNINLKNIEELLFKNNDVKNLFPELRHIFDQWLLSYRFPILNTMRKQAMMDLLNSLDEIHVNKLETFFEDKITVDKLDFHTIKNLKFFINDSIGEELTKYESYNNITINRKGDQVYITLWR